MLIVKIILMLFLKLLLVLQQQGPLYKEVENLSSGILIWRALLQWLGGLGIIVFAIAIIPIFNIGGIKLFTQDWSERPKDLHYRPKEIAKLLGSIYISFTLIILLLLYASGLNLFDAFSHALTTIATGGFSLNLLPLGTIIIFLQN